MDDINKILLEGHRKGIEAAREASYRTGVPLVVMRKGRIVYEEPKYEYVLVEVKRKPKSKKKP